MLSDSRGSIPSTPITITFLPEAPRDVAAATQPVVAHAQSRGADGARGGDRGRALEQGPAVHLGDGFISHQHHLCQSLLLVRWGLLRRHPRRSRPCRPCSRGRPTPNIDSTVGPMSIRRGFSFSTGGCRTGCRARAKDRRSGRRSRPWCWRGTRPSSCGRSPSPTRRDSRAGSRRSGRDRCPVRALVELGGDVDALDGAGAVLRVDQGRQPLGDLFAEAVGLAAGLDDALRVLVLDIDVDSGQADGEGTRSRPVDPGQVLLVAPAVIERQVAVLLEPTVQVDARCGKGRSRGRR